MDDGGDIACGDAADAERFDFVKQIVQRIHAHEAGAAKHGAVEPIERIASRPVRSTSTGLFRAAARGGHEFARGLNRFDGKEDCPCRGIAAGQKIEDIAGINVGFIAKRDDAREAESACARPAEHAVGECVRTGYPGNSAWFDFACGRAKARANGWRNDSQAHQTDYAQQMRSGR